MALFWRIMALGALALAPATMFGDVAYAGSCVPAGSATTCTVVANQDVNSLNNVFPSSPLSTGVNFAAGGTYVLTVANPTTTFWSYDPNLPSVNANGTASGLSLAALVGQVGGGANAVGAFAVSTLGALAVNGTVATGTGGTSTYVPGNTLTLAMLDTDTFNNSGSQTVTVTQAPTVGGLTLANVNVFAQQNSLNSPNSPNNPLGGAGGAVPTGLVLSAAQTYTFVTTDANHLWSMGDTDNRISTADGIPTAVFGDCGAAEGCAPVGGAFEPGVTQFRYGELVALIGGTYYGVGTGRTLSGVGGALSFLNWDSDYLDNLGAMNVTVIQRPDITAAPEPASLLLMGAGLAGLAVLRRRRRVV